MRQLVFGRANALPKKGIAHYLCVQSLRHCILKTAWRRTEHNHAERPDVVGELACVASEQLGSRVVQARPSNTGGPLGLDDGPRIPKVREDDVVAFSEVDGLGPDVAVHNTIVVEKFDAGRLCYNVCQPLDMRDMR